MPNGEFRFLRNTLCVSATPSLSASRNNVMRLALGTSAPARFMASPMSQPLMPLPSPGRFGALVSATNTSPLGSTYSQRGWSSSEAKALTSSPAAGFGCSPLRHPIASATLIVGTSPRLGSGKTGLGPWAFSSGTSAGSQAKSNRANHAAIGIALALKDRVITGAEPTYM